MWRAVWYVLGFCRVRVTGASPEWILERLAQLRVAVIDPVRIDAFTLEFLTLRRSLARVELAACKAMCDVTGVQEYGLRHDFEGLRRRLALVLALMACVLATIIVPKFVFFYEVEGNETVPDAKILRALHTLGVGFGTYGPDIRPQELKNKMLLLIPELQWFTVQQNGMCARVIVRERPKKITPEDRRTATDVIAAKDGVLTSVSVLEGNCLCAPGQAVREGELLVSAFTDLEFTTRVSAALAEIYARTLYRKQVVTPESVLEKTYTGREQTKISLIGGEKRWNIFTNGGKLTGRCDKITVTHMLRLPGGLTLPAGIAVTTSRAYTLQARTVDAQDAKALCRAQALRSIRQEMIAGTVEQETASMVQADGRYNYTASVQCEEMIARMVRARIKEDET